MRGLPLGSAVLALLLATPAFAADLPGAPDGAVADGARVISASDREAIEELARTVESEDGVRLRA
jgi:uncharacterized membrane protein YgcG